MKLILVLAIVFVVVVFGLGAFLSPDDLATCDEQPDQVASCKKADAIVAISGGDTLARADEAVALYQNGWGEKIIFSGAAQDKSGPSNAAVMRQAALDAGVLDSAIIIEEYGETTKQNAEKTQDIFEQNDITSVILVTSSYHQRRASLEFNKRAAGVVTVRNHPVASDKQWSNWWWTTPTGWFLASSEFVKIIAFYIGGTR